MLIAVLACQAQLLDDVETRMEKIPRRRVDDGEGKRHDPGEELQDDALAISVDYIKIE